MFTMRACVLLLASLSQTIAFAPAATRGLVTRHVQPQRQQAATTLHANFLDNLFAQKTTKQTAATPKYPPVVIDRDYRLAAVFLAAGVVLDTVPYVQFLLGLPVTLLGVLFLVQTYRVRFVFDDSNNLAIRIGDELKESGENVVVGGANVWSCDTIVNYEFFPKGWIDINAPFDLPILVYFKETQTESSTWNEGPGASANDPDKIASGDAVAGQVHFFPAVCNAQQIRSEFERRQCGKVSN